MLVNAAGGQPYTLYLVTRLQRPKRTFSFLRLRINRDLEVVGKALRVVMSNEVLEPNLALPKMVFYLV